MPELIIDPSVHAAEAQMQALSETHRLTVVCGLVAPATGQIALVQTIKSANEEPPKWGLQPPQGGVEPGENLTAAFLRELSEEVGLDTGLIGAVYGLPMDPPITGGKPRREGDKTKAYGVLCGTIGGDGQPPRLHPRPHEIAKAEWRPLHTAASIFNFQSQRQDIAVMRRGMRNRRILYAIRSLDLPMR